MNHTTINVINSCGFRGIPPRNVVDDIYTVNMGGGWGKVVSLDIEQKYVVTLLLKRNI